MFSHRQFEYNFLSIIRHIHSQAFNINFQKIYINSLFKEVENKVFSTFFNPPRMLSIVKQPTSFLLISRLDMKIWVHIIHESVNELYTISL